MRPRLAMLCLLVPAACGPQGVTIGGQTGESAVSDDSSAPDDTAPEVAPGDTSPDDSGKTDGGSLQFEPNGGTFVLSTEVALSAGGSAIEYCLADPDASTCTMQAYAAPFAVSDSTIVHARIAGTTDEKARAFIEVEDNLAAFSSPIPLFVAYTQHDAPADTSTHVPMGLVVLEPPEGDTIAMLDAPADSGRARMRVRGSSSSSFDKKAYDMELWDAAAEQDRSEALLGLPENGDWVLYAPYYFDDALIRNPLAYTLSNQIGRYAPRTKFFELFMGVRGRPVRSSDYLGVYVLTEEVERDVNRVNVVPILPEDVNDPEVTGGYIVKIDRVGDGESGFTAGTAGGRWNFQQTFVAVQPDEATLERAQSAYLEARLDSLGWALAADDLTDPFGGLRYDEIMDVDTFIDHHIVNVVMKNPDSFRLSGYMFQDREGLVSAGPVWDFDRAAGSTDSRAFNPHWWDAQNETPDCTAVFDFGWYAGLFEIPEFQDRYWTRFETLLTTDYSDENIQATIDALAANLDEPAARNAATWGSEPFDDEITKLKEWFRERDAWMLNCVQTYPDPRDCPG